MLDKRIIKLNIFYSLAGLIGLVAAAALIFSLTEVSKEVAEEGRPTIPASASNSDKRSVIHDRDNTEITGYRVDQVNSLVDVEPCSARCGATLSMLDEGLEIDDETYQRLETHAQEIAAFLQGNERQRQHYLQIALTTTDGDKRAFLSSVFTHLPYEQKVEIGEDFIGSENWRVRADGVTLIADPAIPNADMANTLMGVFSSEENSYVKGRILNYVKQGASLKGDTQILHQLDSAIYNEANPYVRVAAFKAKMQLSAQPHHMLPDALQALRTTEPELQFASIVAIERILEHHKQHPENSVYLDRSSIKNEFQIIRNLTIYDDDKERFDRLIREANSIYLRYFDQQNLSVELLHTNTDTCRLD